MVNDLSIKVVFDSADVDMAKEYTKEAYRGNPFNGLSKTVKRLDDEIIVCIRVPIKRGMENALLKIDRAYYSVRDWCAKKPIMTIIW